MASRVLEQGARALLLAPFALTPFLIGCGSDCACETFQHLGQKVFISQCDGQDAVDACTEVGGRGGKEGIGGPVPAHALSATTVICIAASNGMKPGLSTYGAIWDPNRNGSEDWWVQMIQEEHCYSADHVDGRADTWNIDANSGAIQSYGRESYTAVQCAYGELSER